MVCVEEHIVQGNLLFQNYFKICNRFLWTWPTSKIGVMGGEQVKSEQLKIFI